MDLSSKRENLRRAAQQFADQEYVTALRQEGYVLNRSADGIHAALTHPHGISENHDDITVSIGDDTIYVRVPRTTTNATGAEMRRTLLAVADNWRPGIWSGGYLALGQPMESWLLNRGLGSVPEEHIVTNTIDSPTANPSRDANTSTISHPTNSHAHRARNSAPLAPPAELHVSATATERVHSHRRNTSNDSSGSYNPFDLGRNQDLSYPTEGPRNVPGRSRSDSYGQLNASANAHRRTDSDSSGRSLALSHAANPFTVGRLPSESSGSIPSSLFSQNHGRNPSQSHVSHYTTPSGTLGSLPSGSTHSQLMDGSGPTGSSTSWPVERLAWADRYRRADNHSDYRSDASGHRSNSSRDSDPSGHRSNSSGHRSNSSGQYSSPLAESPARTGLDNPNSAPNQLSAYPVAAPHQGVPSYGVQTSEDYNPSNPAYALPTSTRGNTSYHPGATRSDRSNSFGQRSDTSGHHLGSPAYAYQGPANFGNPSYPQTQPFMNYRPRPREEYPDEDSD